MRTVGIFVAFVGTLWLLLSTLEAVPVCESCSPFRNWAFQNPATLGMLLITVGVVLVVLGRR
jgi:hypothetical protein